MTRAITVLLLGCTLVGLSGCGNAVTPNASSAAVGYLTACDAQWDRLYDNTMSIVSLVDSKQLDDRATAIATIERIKRDVDTSSDKFASTSVPETRLQSVAEQVQTLDKQEQAYVNDYLTGIKGNEDAVLTKAENELIAVYKSSLDVRDSIYKIDSEFGVVWTPQSTSSS